MIKEDFHPRHQAYTATASCVDPKLHTCSGEMLAKKGGTGLCTGDLDTLHCCAGKATEIPPGDKLCTSSPLSVCFVPRTHSACFISVPC